MNYNHNDAFQLNFNYIAYYKRFSKIDHVRPVYIKRYYLQRNKTPKAYLIILHNKIYRNRHFGSKKKKNVQFWEN